MQKYIYILYTYILIYRYINGKHKIKANFIMNQSLYSEENYYNRYKIGLRAIIYN